MVNISSQTAHSMLPVPSHMESGWAFHSGHPVTSVNPSRSQDAAEARQQMVRAGQQFEAYFISYMLKVMRETIPEGTVANKQGAYFYSFYDEEIGVRAAESGGIGIAKMVQEYAHQYFSSSPVDRSSSSE